MRSRFRGRLTGAVLAVIALPVAACASASGVSVPPPGALPPAASSTTVPSTTIPSTTIPSSAVSVPAQASAQISVQPASAAHPYSSFLVTGRLSGVRNTVLVRLPPAYFDPAQASRRFPVIETFHGSPGHAPQWIGKMKLGTVLDSEASAHRIVDAIVVSPDMNYPTNQDRECVDGGPGQQLETWAAIDVPDWVQHTFRASTDRNGWATIGLSAGGWCAAMTAALHPDRFRAAIVMSGYFRPVFPKRAPYPANSLAARRYDLVALTLTSPPPIDVWVETSRQDADSYPTSKLFTTHPPLMVHTTVLPMQDHSWTVWRAGLPAALDWLARSAPGFAPAP